MHVKAKLECMRCTPQSMHAYIAYMNTYVTYIACMYRIREINTELGITDEEGMWEPEEHRDEFPERRLDFTTEELAQFERCSRVILTRAKLEHVCACVCVCICMGMSLAGSVKCMHEATRKLTMRSTRRSAKHSDGGGGGFGGFGDAKKADGGVDAKSKGANVAGKPGAHDGKGGNVEGGTRGPAKPAYTLSDVEKAEVPPAPHR
jgi:hypothetical protein